MNAVGPVSCDLNYWYKPTINNKTFDEDIFISVEEQKKQIEAKTIIPIEPEFVVRIVNPIAGRILSQQQLNKLVAPFPNFFIIHLLYNIKYKIFTFFKTFN